VIELPAGSAQLDAINASFRIGSHTLSHESATVRAELKLDDLTAVLQIATQAHLQAIPGLEVPGAAVTVAGLALEIDVVALRSFDTVDEIMAALQSAHDRAVELYKDIVTRES
jgi:hypothetical protein